MLTPALHLTSHLFLLAVSTSLASSAPPDRGWRVVGEDLVPAPAETRPVAKAAGDRGLRLSGRGTPFIVAPRIDVLEGGPPTDAITLEGWISIDRPTRWGGVIGAIQDNGEAETGVLLGYGNDAPYFAVSAEGTDDVDGQLTYLTADTPYTIGKWHHLVGTYDGLAMRLLSLIHI